MQAVSWAIAWLWLSKWESGTRLSFWYVHHFDKVNQLMKTDFEEVFYNFFSRNQQSSSGIITSRPYSIFDDHRQVPNKWHPDLFKIGDFDRLMAVNPWVQTWWRAAESLGRLSQVLGRSSRCLLQTVTPTRFLGTGDWLCFCINPPFCQVLCRHYHYFCRSYRHLWIVSSDLNPRLSWWVSKNPIYNGRTSRIWGCSLGGGGWLRNGLA